jgi:hypothetical protein
MPAEAAYFHARRFIMSKVWAWVLSIVMALCIFGLMAYGRSERQAYWAARGVIVHQAGAQPIERSPFGHRGR